jgi:hypothetical protein
MDKERQKKIFLMRVGVMVVAALVLIFWIFNLKNIWHPTAVSSNEEDLTWLEFREELEKTTEEIESKLGAFKDGADEVDNTIVESGEDSLPDNDLIIDIIEKTKENSIDKVKNCPEYINCMPTIGEEPRSCVIPPGCEDITIIAY